MAFNLSDDGTLDTVVKCNVCGAELRYNYDGPDMHAVYSAPNADDESDRRYRDFVEWAIEDAEADHVCGENN
jgi:RNase P subunit RPR2